MSTRCQTGFEGGDVLVYRHTDGYPTSMLVDLSRFVNVFMKSRGPDEPYMAARLCAMLARTISSGSTVGPEGQTVPKEKRGSQFDFLSIGVDTYFHADIAWFYFVKHSGAIEVYRPAGDPHGTFNGKPPSSMRLVGTLTLDSTKAVATAAAKKAEAAADVS